MSYKSKHTGAQVDEAVSKVLNGDIEGSNIKDGSVPLSALDYDFKKKIKSSNVSLRPVKSLLSLKHTTERNPDTDDERYIIFVDSYLSDLYEEEYEPENPHFCVKHFTNEVIELVPNQDITINGNTFRLNNIYDEELDEIYNKLVIFHPFSNPSVDDFYIIDENELVDDLGDIMCEHKDSKDLPFYLFYKIEENSIPQSALREDVQKKLSTTPDWNAQKGEAGYIENRPFYDNINNKFDINDFEERIETEEEFGETYTYSVYTATIHNFDRYNLAIKIKSFEDYDYYFIKYKEEKEIWTSNGSMNIKPSSDNEEIIIEIVDPTNFQNYLDNVYYRLYEDYFNNYIKHIKDVYLPDTVIKTTPQTLSTNDKNQALSNLGIDNTKYILSVAPDNKFNIREFIDKFGFIAALNDDGYGGYIGELVVANQELFLDNVLCCGLNNTSLAKCIYVKDNDVVFFFEEGLAKGNVKVSFAENDINSAPLYICWEPIMN